MREPRPSIGRYRITSKGTNCARLILDAERVTEPQEMEPRIEFSKAVFEYIKVVCNRRRRNSHLGWSTPPVVLSALSIRKEPG